jgi:two-component system cell cycle sensor histidine kinase/response regulator CckA
MSDFCDESASLSASPIFQRLKFESMRMAAGGVVHEFNNHLAAIDGNNNILLGQLDDNSNLGTHARLLQEATDLALSLTRRLSIYTSRLDPQFISFDLETFLASSLPALQKLAPPHQLTIETESSCPNVSADANLLRMSLDCLVSNAHESMTDNEGTVSVTAGFSRSRGSTDFFFDFPPPVDPFFFVEVRDSGCGMVPSVRSRIFDPFFSTKIRGHGMGLPCVLGVVRMHGGNISVKTAPDQGTTITLVLPLNPSGENL